MTLQEILKLVKQAGGIEQTPYDYGAKSDGVILKHDALLDLVDLVTQHEREACAQLCEEQANNLDYGHDVGCYDCAKAIRSHGENK